MKEPVNYVEIFPCLLPILQYRYHGALGPKGQFIRWATKIENQLVQLKYQ